MADYGPITQSPQVGDGQSANAQGPATTGQQQLPTYDPDKVQGEVNQKFSSWRQLKRPIEVNWFITNAMTRGLQNVKWNDTLAKLETRQIPSHKIPPSINKILPKYRARKAKFLKNRYTPVIVPASSDREDKLNADASQLALEYLSRATKLEKIYRQTLDWSLTCGKAFIWLYWDQYRNAMVKDPQSGQAVSVPIGDVCFESGNPFEVLTPDIGIQRIGDQPEVMRVKARPLLDLKLRYKDVAGIDGLKGDSNSDDLFQYQKQIATLSNKTNVGLVSALSDKSDRDLNYVICKELFTKPNSNFPRGRYVVVAGSLVLKYQEFLPYGFENNYDNPYPVVEFPDIELAGQFWPTSMVEQLVGPQREYNERRQQLTNHVRKMAHPKVITSVFSKWPENAWNDEAGEVIRILTPPGIMEPKIITPPAISQDLYQNINMVREEIDEISGLPPSALGTPAGATSGFQTNLLQEGADSVHAPDIRSHEMGFEELYSKARKLMAQGYTEQRLITIAGRAHIPDVVEFSTDNIDENAEIIVYTGSALANSPAVRTQQVIELWNSGILQDDQNPAEGKRRALTMLDANGIGEFQEEKRGHESKARLENLNIGKSQNVNPPIPFDDHIIHMQTHTDQTISPEFDTWSPPQQQELFAHMVMHVKYINPMDAMNLALELGLTDPAFLQMLQPPQMPPPSGAPPQPQGAPAQGPQPPGPPPPAQGNQPPNGGVPPPQQ